MDELGFAEAQAGDEVSVASHRLRGAARTGTIVEVLGSPGHEYFLVRWADGRETTLHPGPDARLVPKGARRRARPPAAEAPAPKARPRPRKPRTKEPAAPAPAPGAPRGRRELQALRAAAGDRLVIKGHHLGERTRDAEILEVLGDGGGPPFRVRWSDTGREGMLYPGPDALVEHFPRRKRRAPRAGG